MNIKYVNIDTNNKKLNINCVKAEKIDTLLNYPHVHDEMEIVYLLSGNLSVIINEEEINMKAGETVFINRLASHHFFRISNDAEYILLQFKPHILYNKKVINVQYLQPFYNTKDFTHYLSSSINENSTDFADCINNIYNYCEDAFAYDIMTQSLLIKLLFLFYKNDIFNIDDNSLTDKAKATRRIAKLQEYIEQHFASELTVSFACEFVNLDYHYFSRLFKQETGKTFIEYVTMIRIIHAQEMLKKTNHPVIYIAQSVGIPNITYFNRVFKNHCGITPRQYRNSENGKPNY